MRFVGTVRAWAALVSAILAITGCSGGEAAPIERQPRVYAGCDHPSDAPGRTVTVDNPARLTSAIRQARPGDVITLRDGDFGKIVIDGEPGGFVTVTAASGAKPTIQSIEIGGHRATSHWIVRGLTLSGPGEPGVETSGWPKHSLKIRLDNATDVIVQSNRLETAPGDYPWRPEARGVPDEAPLASGILATNGDCVAIIDNQLHNVFLGIAVDGDQGDRRGVNYLVEGNTIDQFAGDGIDHSVSHALIRWNTITNAHDICQNICIHTDGIQGWTHWGDPKITNTDVTIDGNVIIAQDRADLPMPADDIHGITIFDGHWDGVQIENNAVVTDTWNGITLFGVRHATIINNTLVGTNPARPTMLMIAPAKPRYDRVNSDDIILKNNIIPKLIIDKGGVGPADISADHNLVGADPRGLFVRFDPRDGSFDLHPRPGSEVLGKGSATLAPTIDADGHTRIAPIDLGAYARPPG
jgi:hypothetical protein